MNDGYVHRDHNNERAALTQDARMFGWIHKPTDEDLRRALILAREVGILTDEGFIWEHQK